jgi:photosystem II stability/assembly factor-like uncharacterized protein
MYLLMVPILVLTSLNPSTAPPPAKAAEPTLSWQNASPTNNNLYGIYGTDATHLWAVGEGGSIGFYDGSSWINQSSDTSENLKAISGLDQNNLWAVGGSGTILKYNGSSWASQTSGITQNIQAISALDSTHLWAVGASGTILFYNGSSWSAQTSGTSQELKGIRAYDATNVWAVGLSGTILKFNGTSWSSETSGTANDLYGVWPISAAEIWTVGEKGTILKSDGTTWTSQTSPTNRTLYGLYGYSSQLWAVGEQGTVIQYQQYWLTGTSNANKDLYGVLAIDQNNIWTIGEEGLLLKLDQTLDWTSYHANVDDLFGIDGLSATDIWIVSERGQLLHSDGTSWSGSNSTTTQDLYAIDVLDSSHLWAVGSSGAIQFYDSSSWASQTSGTTNNLYGVYSQSSSNVWAVGESGTILYYNGSSWANQTSGTTEDLLGIFGLNSSNIWAVGNNGTILKYNGSSWASQTSGTTKNLTSVWAASINYIWTVGEGGTILYSSGSSWSNQNSYTQNDLKNISGIDSTHYWIVGEEGTACLNGACDIAPIVSNNLNSIFYYDANSYWAVGSDGIILKKGDGINWTFDDNYLSQNLTTVSGSLSSNFNVGSGLGAKIHNYNGTTWSTKWSSGNSDDYLEDINGGWAVTSNGKILYLSYSSWNEFYADPSKSFYGVRDIDNKNVLAVGRTGTIYSCLLGNIEGDGVDPPPNCSDLNMWELSTVGTDNLYRVSALDYNNIWVVGGNDSGDHGTILYYVRDNNKEVGGFDTQYSGTDYGRINDVWALNQSNVWATSRAGILKFNGTTWSLQESRPEFRNLLSVYGKDSSHIWAVGSKGRVAFFNGTSWSMQTSPTIVTLRDVLAFSSTDIWAVGDAGIILRSGGSTWERYKINFTSNTLRSVDVLDPNNLWVGSNNNSYINGAIFNLNWVGSREFTYTNQHVMSIEAINTSDVWAIKKNITVGGYDILHYTGSSWSIDKTGVPYEILWGIDGYDANNIWVVGANYQNMEYKTLIYKYDGASWGPNQLTDSSFQPRAVSAFDASNVWSVGFSGEIYRYNGSDWTPQTSGVSTNLIGVNALDDQHVWAVGTSGTILYTENGGSTWSAQTSGTTQDLYGVYALDATHVWAVGTSGTILYTENGGSTWSAQTSGVTSSLYDVDGSSLNNIWAVGSSGTILKLNYSQANQSKTFNQNNLNSLNGSSQSSLSAVGEQGSWLKYDGSSWVWQDSSTNQWLNDTDSLSASETWAVGQDGTILKLTGSYGASQTSNTTENLMGVSVLDGSNVWSVGENGTILKYNGSSWSAQTSGTSNHLNAVDALNASNVWAVGDTGTILKFNGTSWTTQTSGTTQNLYGVYALDASRVWAVGAGGTILFYNGTSWSSETSGTTDKITTISGNHLTNVWVTTENGKILRFDGRTWEALSPFTSKYLSAIFDLDTNNLWTVGQKGSIIKINSPSLTPTATKLLVVPPGQSFTDGSTVSGSPTTQTAGSSFTASFYAVDDSNAVDFTNASTISFTTTDLADTHPANLILSYGSGTATFTLKTSTGSGWTISAIDEGASLATGTSEAILVNPGLPATISFTTSAQTIYTNQVSGIMTINLADSFGNISPAGDTTNFNLTSSSSSGKFALSDTGPWTATSITLTPSQSEGSFYYKDSTAGSLLVKVAETPSLGWTDAEQTETIIESPTPTPSPTPTTDTTPTPTPTPTPSPENYYLTLSPLSSPIKAGQLFSLEITIYKNLNIIDLAYRGTIAFTSSDKIADLPQDYIFTSVNQGKKNFTNLSFKTVGEQSLLVQDKDKKFSGSAMIRVIPDIVSATSSSFTVNPLRVKADGQDSAKITISLTDQYQNSIAGKKVFVNSSRAEDQISTQSSNTDQEGNVFYQITSSIPGTAMLTAVDLTDNITLYERPGVTFYAPTAINSITSTMANNYDRVKEKIKKLEKTIEESPVAQAISNKVLHPVLVASVSVGTMFFIFNVLASMPQSIHVLAYSFTTLLETLGVRRRRPPWGIVYDAVTKLPVSQAMVRLYDTETHKLIETRVTDQNGSYGFLVFPSSYTITVSKANYHFPSSLVTGTIDQFYTDLYFGKTLKIKKEKQTINVNVPIDPQLERLSVKSRLLLSRSKITSALIIFLEKATIPFLFLGVLIGVFNFLVFPTYERTLIIVLYFFLTIFVATRRRSKKGWGTVFDLKSHKPLPGALVQIFENEFNTLRESRITDSRGRYTFLIEPGNYYLRTILPHFIFPAIHLSSKARKKAHLYVGQPFQVHTKTIINFNVPMEIQPR